MIDLIPERVWALWAEWLALFTPLFRMLDCWEEELPEDL